jgi:ketosteroid isomerase-like protein
MRYLAVFLVLINLQFSFGQPVGEAVLKEEANFAEMSKKVGVKAAFLEYLSTEAIVFSEGKPVNGHAHWNKLDFSGKLEWQANFVEVSKAHDLAYTIGTYQFYWKKNQEKPTEIGYFSSIWKKQENGQWKVVLDFGNPAKNETVLSINSKLNSNRKIIEPTYNQIIKGDTSTLKMAIFTSDFLLSNQINKSKTNLNPFAKNAHIFTKSDIKYMFKPLKTEVSVSGDLAYVYGNVSYPDHANANYLRIWRKEGRKSWKVALEMVTE